MMLPQRFGPKVWLYVVALAGVAMIVTFSVYDLELSLLATGILFVGVTLPGWAWYEVTRQGLDRKTPFASAHYAWSDLEGVSSHEVESRRHPSETTVALSVRDKDGRTLFRLSPWLAKRSELARLIREGVRELQST